MNIRGLAPDEIRAKEEELRTKINIEYFNKMTRKQPRKNRFI